MIISFRHKGLEAFYRKGSVRGVQVIHQGKLRELLTALQAAASPADLSRPSWALHPLRGDRKGFYAITVQANWRLIFCFVGADVELVDYLDYH